MQREIKQAIVTMDYLSKRPTLRITSARFELAFPTS
jgi:hypothetical protein